jgi:uncharacterized protein YdhG (YjbR/CyaY superfamily)
MICPRVCGGAGLAPAAGLIRSEQVRAAIARRCASPSATRTAGAPGEIVPEAEQVISYRVPAFRVRGQTVAGFAAFQKHLSYLPFSDSVLSQLADQLEGYTMTKSALHFPVDHPPPRTLVKKLIAVRLRQVEQRSR